MSDYELGTIVVTCDDGDSWPSVFGGLDDFLVEVTCQDGTMISGYVLANNEGLRLRPTSQFIPSSHGSTQLNWDYIKTIHVL